MWRSFNEYVRSSWRTFEARWRDDYDFYSLFCSRLTPWYLMQKIQAYIEAKKSGYEEGRMAIDLLAFTSEYLMPETTNARA
jgi:hypothetical protein